MPIVTSSSSDGKGDANLRPSPGCHFDSLILGKKGIGIVFALLSMKGCPMRRSLEDEATRKSIGT